MTGQTISLVHSEQNLCNIIFDNLNSHCLKQFSFFILMITLSSSSYRESNCRSMLINILNKFEFKQGALFLHLLLQSLRRFQKDLFALFWALMKSDTKETINLYFHQRVFMSTFLFIRRNTKETIILNPPWAWPLQWKSPIKLYWKSSKIIKKLFCSCKVFLKNHKKKIK